MTDAVLKVVASPVTMAIRAPSVQRLTIATPAPVRLTIKPSTVVGIAVPKQGPPGPQGRPGTTGPVATIVCAEMLAAAGVPVYVDRASLQLRAARADTYRAAFVAGLVTAETTLGFAADVLCGQVILPDWTGATGSPDLAPGLVYFLAPAGGLTTVAPVGVPGVSIVTVGRAADSRTLFVAPSNPILQ